MRPVLRPRRSFHCRSTLPCDVRAAGALVGAGGCPTVGAGIVSPAGFTKSSIEPSAPDDHFTAASTLPCGGLGAVGALVMLVAIQLSVLGLYLPPVLSRRCHQFRPRRSFQCRSTLLCDQYRAEGALIVLVAVQVSVLGLYLPPVFKIGITTANPPPHDHFTAGPHCRVRRLAQRARCCWWSLSKYPCRDCICRHCLSG